MTATLRPHLPDWTPGSVTAEQLRASQEAEARLAERAYETKKPYAEQIKDAGVKAYVWEKTS